MAKQKRERRPNFKSVPVKTSVEALLDEAFSEYESLAEEMRSWADALEEKLSHTEKYDRVTEAADTLENISRPDVGEGLDLEVTYNSVNPRKIVSRAQRRDHASFLLDLAIDALQDNEWEDADKEQEANDLASEIENARDEADGADFPGMYG